MTRTTRLHDLAEPRHAPAVREQLEAAKSIAPTLSFEIDALCAQAVAETGLSDFGSDSFRPGLEALLESLRSERPFSAFGRVSKHAEILRFLRNRLCVEDLFARHPEAEDVEIARPIVITGFPRTGTTHLHNAMAADPALRTLPYWEALEPVLPGEEPAPFRETDPRIARCRAALEWVNGAMPHFPKMHDMTWDHAHEEIDLLARDFSTMYLEAPGPLRAYSEWYKESDKTASYRYMKRALQAITFLRGGDRWALKTPQHLELLPVLAEVFPDATLVLNHRDPLPIVASYLTMMTYTARRAQERPDPHGLGAFLVDRVGDMLDACVRDRDVWPATQSIDIAFHELVADGDAMVARAYAKAGQPLDDVSKRAIADYARTHPQGRHGRIDYDLADFGLDAGHLRERFRKYTDRFAVRLEMEA